MFASADGFDFKNMTAKPSLTGSDSQDVVFRDARAGGGNGAYVLSRRRRPYRRCAPNRKTHHASAESAPESRA